MRRIAVGLTVLGLAWPAMSHATCGGCKAERVTAATANALLFGGTDASGGIDDWALTNGKIQAIVDDIGNQDPIAVVGGSVSVEHTSSNAVETGGTLIDLGLKGKNNDQLPQSFNVGGLSLANVFLFRPNDGVAGGWSPAPSHNPCASVEGSDPTCPADPNCVAITVYGIMLSPNVSSRTAPTMWVRTRYQACSGSTSLQLRTEVWNKSGVTQNNPIFDVFLWGGRGITPFVANSGRGFNHPILQLSALEAIANLNATSSPFFAAPGNVNKKNGKVARGKNAGAVSYGYRSEGGLVDNDGPNGGGAGAPFVGGLPDQLKALHANLLSAVTFASIPGGPLVPDGGSVIFNRRIVVGGRNDAASVLGDTHNLDSVFTLMGYGTGTVSGHISPGSKEEATIVFIRDGGPALSPPIENNSPVSQVRTKASFSNVQLPEGNYSARVYIPGKDELVIPGAFTITAFNNSVLNIDASVLPKPGTLQFTVVDGSSNPIPAKVSISPSPSFHKDLVSFNFNRKTGICSNDLTTECVNDGDCSGTCFRTCANVATTHCQSVSDCSGPEVCASDGHCRSHACVSDAACGSGEICVADAIDNQPEGFAGGNAQLSVIYTENGKVKQSIKPGTYDVYVSRGLEYSIKRIQGVTISAGATNNSIGNVTLKRVVDTTGYESADFHIHSCRSLDSSATLLDRVRSFAGEGIEVMISTDHDINTDYSTSISKLKVGSFIGSIVGTEVTTSVGTPPYFSNSWGHINGWPEVYDPNIRRSGSIEDENTGANVIYDRLRAVSDKLCVGGRNSSKPCTTLGPGSECPMGTCTDVGQQVVSLNHPRAGASGVVNIGMFDNIGYDPSDTISSCHKYPVICPSSSCYNGTNDGTGCTNNTPCTGGGVCGCDSASVPLSANGCNNILRDLNVVPQSTVCDTPGCGSGFEDAAGTRNVDFDMMEIDNGGSASSFGGLREVRRDWMSFLNQNVLVGENGNRHPLWGEGVSDSHRIVAELPGYSRTYVGAGDFTGSSTLNIKTFNDNVRAGNMTATAGPYIEFTLDNGGTPKKMGETLSVPGGGAVNLNIKVKAAPWIPVEEVRVIQNGCVVACFNDSTVPAVTNNPSVDADYLDDTTTRVVRFNAAVPETAGADSYFIVEASPNLPTPGDDPAVDPFVNAVAGGDFPFGFTNPIFVDTDGSGYGGIGVPEPVCGALPASCSLGAAISSAPTAKETMFAKNDADRGWLARLWGRIVGTAAADEQEKRPPNEEDRIREHEKNIRKSSQEYYPWKMIKLPTPQPQQEPAPK